MISKTKNKKPTNNDHIYSHIYGDKYLEDLVQEVRDDFKVRQQERKSYENQWQLNMNFLLGNQYCTIAGTGDIEDYEKQYFWQEREIYNHIAPLVEVRISKLSKVRPTMSVVPASTSEADINTAKVSKNIINSAYHKLSLSEKISDATVWSEICGTSFYKVTWDSKAGNIVGIDEEGNKIKEGDINVTVCPPYEIFPESNNATSIDDCRSIIHAKAYHIDDIKSIWGAEVKGENIDVFSLDNISTIGGLGYTASVPKVISKVKSNHAIVIEKYESPSVDHPNGRVIIVAGDKLLYIGELPYVNRVEDKRGFPFIKQDSIEQPGSFWGTSIIERLIPVQRAYNAVKNRKHEFLNRISMGILTVEDGSVDVDNLEEEGLSPGKVLIYRQGSSAPKIMDSGEIPSDFSDEEERLLNEFIQISGVSDLMLNSKINTSTISGNALEILLEQDNTRLNSVADQVKFCAKHLAAQILRLYKQFTVGSRLAKIIGKDGSVEMFYFESSNINSDDIIFETQTELGETLTQKRNMIFELLKAGLLQDENGKLSNRIRSKTLEMLGFGVWEDRSDLNELQIDRAKRENLDFAYSTKKIEVLEIDDHKLHIDEHIAFMLGGEYEKTVLQKPKLKDMLLEHINEHKALLQTQ
ncbi:MAG: hypothetical protein AB7S44_00575 [Spirochaetales bacterium]